MSACCQNFPQCNCDKTLPFILKFESLDDLDSVLKKISTAVLYGRTIILHLPELKGKVEYLGNHIPDQNGVVIVPNPTGFEFVDSLMDMVRQDQKRLDDLSDLLSCKVEDYFLPDELNKDYYLPLFPCKVKPVVVPKVTRIFNRRFDRRGRKPGRKVML